MTAAQTDRASEGNVKGIAAHGTRQELRPLWSLNWHSKMRNHHGQCIMWGHIRQRRRSLSKSGDDMLAILCQCGKFL